MESPRDTETPVLDSENKGKRGDGHGGDHGTAAGDRDLRDVLRHLVVDEGDRGDVSLSTVAAAAAGTDRLVPELLGALDDESTPVRVGAAWTLCALADDQPGAVGYLATRLAGRVDDGPFEVGQVFAYLKGRYPGRVADAVDVAVDVEGMDDREGESGLGGTDPCPGSPDRAPATTDRRDRPTSVDDVQGKRVETDGGVPAGTVTDLGDGRQVVRPNREGRPAQPAAPSRPAGPGGSRRQSTPPEPPSDHPTHPDYESQAAGAAGRNASTAGGTGSGAGAVDSPAPGSAGDGVRPTAETNARTETGGGGEATTSPRSRTKPAATPDTFAAIASLSSLDRLSAVDRGVEERYAEGYRCRAVSDEEERGAAVRLFERPDPDDRLAFRQSLEDCLARWEALSDCDGVVGVTEWGLRPRPWARLQPVDASLAERGPPDAASAVDQAVDLAEAVAALHARGAVHAGLDPKNVVYPCDIEALDRPLVDNVGLMGAFREHFEPANYLDPRFAAPEYYDDDFGSVDAATDVYGLGAVVYYLVTGRPPFDGSYAAVRRGVLGERPPAPSEVSDGAPPRLDAVIAKALAKEKLKRYDGVEPFRRALERVRDGG